ncbi:hypothetical protein LTR28_004227 [Elasticomyces elasticus]|nr:hypothetical protein LTR28_004227 [Elasticomyces elasticus]
MISSTTTTILSLLLILPSTLAVPWGWKPHHWGPYPSSNISTPSHTPTGTAILPSATGPPPTGWHHLATHNNPPADLDKRFRPFHAYPSATGFPHPTAYPIPTGAASDGCAPATPTQRPSWAYGQPSGEGARRFEGPRRGLGERERVDFHHPGYAHTTPGFLGFPTATGAEWAGPRATGGWGGRPFSFGE